MILKLIKSNLSIQFLLILIVSSVFGSYLPEIIIRFFYSISLTIRDVLYFLLPAITFCCLFSCFSNVNGNKTMKMMGLLLIIVFTSNYFSTILAFIIGSCKLIGFNKGTVGVFQEVTELLPLWDIKITPLVSNDFALIAGLGLGYFFSIYPNIVSTKFHAQSSRLVTFFLTKVFVPVLPFFALGFILKIQSSGTLITSMHSYISLMGIIIVTYTIYILFLFAVAANFKFKDWIFYLKNVTPVMFTALSTMSSLITMPVTMSAAERNTKNENFIRLVIPATVNIHTIGLAIGIPLIALTILSDFGHAYPSFSTYSKFALFFVITQLAIAAVPGSGILIMIPLLETHLGFTSEMSALIAALYILFDPIETVANTLGNSAFAIILHNLTARLKVPLFA